MPPMSAIEAVLEVLASAGVRYLFGNPGSMEFPLLDALARDKRIEYVLGLHEVPVIAMADGYAQATGSLAVANVHISPGLGNSMGMLYNAWRAGTPLLLTAGQQDRRLAFEEPVLWSDVRRVVEPYTKWSADVQHAHDLARAVRRAIKEALTPPTGPVFLALPLDLQVEVGDFDTQPPHVPDRGMRPGINAVHRAADLLLHARSPVILAGCRVAEAGASEVLGKLSEQLGAPVFSDPITNHGRIPIPSDHPLYGGALPTLAPEVRELLEPHDVILAVGMDLLTQYFYRGISPLPPGVTLLQLDNDPYEIGKNYVPTIGMQGDPAAGLAAISERIATMETADQQQAAQERVTTAAAHHSHQRNVYRAACEAERTRQPLTARALMGIIAELLPSDTIVVDEAVTSSALAFERLGWLRDTGAYYGHRGWALGWGIGAAIGAALAYPGRPILCLLGEGSLLYGVQGLWTAAQHKLPITFVVCNNAGYAILKEGMLAAKFPSALTNSFVGLDLVAPEIDFVGVAQSFGVPARRAETATEVEGVLRAAFESRRPTLVDIPIDRTIGAAGPKA
ncbi:MAG: thiamine pyrophosphate-binding protein [Herpetosiphon sp.]